MPLKSLKQCLTHGNPSVHGPPVIIYVHMKCVAEFNLDIVLIKKW